MSFELLRSLVPLTTVHAKPDVTRVNPDGRGRRHQKEHEQAHPERQDGEASSRPVPNAQGQLTGKLIDTVA